MNVILHLKANARVLSTLARSHEPVLAAPDSGNDPYYHRDCHPEIVERVWDQIGAAYPSEGRCLVYGRPSLVDPASGVIVALAFGTAYCVRIPVAAVPEAIKLGAKLSMNWSGGTTTDIQAELGEGWVFGAWLTQEIEWTQEACAALPRNNGGN